MTDESGAYRGQIRDVFSVMAASSTRAGEYGRGDVHTNTVEGYFSIFKRGMKGVYQHCAEKHLHRYVAEFDFRYNNRAALGCEDGEGSVMALQGIAGKRLTYTAANGASLA